MTVPPPEPSDLLPPPAVLRERLARALRDADILSGLLKLSERVRRRDGHSTAPNCDGKQMPTGDTAPSLRPLAAPRPA